MEKIHTKLPTPDNGAELCQNCNRFSFHLNAVGFCETCVNEWLDPGADCPPKKHGEPRRARRASHLVGAGA